MKVFYHDDTPAKPGEKHGTEGPTHCATANVDYEYQAEQHVIDAEKDYPFVVRIDCPELKRSWKRNASGKFEEDNKNITIAKE